MPGSFRREMQASIKLSHGAVLPVLLMLLLSLCLRPHIPQLPPFRERGWALGDPWSVLWMGEGREGFRSVAVMVGAVYAVGYTTSRGAGHRDIFMAKYTPEGVWMQNWTWGGGLNDEAWSLALSPHGVYLAGATTSFGAGSSDGLLIKFDHTDKQLWNVSWGEAGWDQFRSIALTSDGVYVAGTTQSFGAGGNDAILVKFAFNGTLLWNTTWGGAGHDYGLGVAAASDAVYLAGATTSFGAGGNDTFIACFSPAGIQVWNSTWGGSGHDVAQAVTIDNRTIHLAGTTSSFSSDGADLLLLTYNSSGDLQSDWTFSFNHNSQDKGYAITADGDGHLYIAGDTGQPNGPHRSLLLHLNMTDTYPELVWNRTWGGAGHCLTYGLCLGLDGLYIAGSTSGWIEGGADAFLVKYHLDGSATPGPIQLQSLPSTVTTSILTVSWTPGHDPDGCIAGYELQMDTTPTFQWPAITWTTNDTQIQATGLHDGTYYFRVRARDDKGLYGPWSNTIKVTVNTPLTPSIDPWLAPTILAIGAFIMATIAAVVSIHRWRTS